MSAPMIPGAEVWISHDLGRERGILLSASRPAYGEQPWYTVQFSDGTISAWPEHRVSPI